MSTTKNTPLNKQPLNEARFLFLLRTRLQSAILICCVRNFNLFGSKLLALADVILFSSYMFRVPKKNPIRVLTLDMFSTPSRTFEILCYVVEVANLLAEAPSPPPIRTRPFNKLVEHFLDIEAEEGMDRDRHGSPSC